jgi:cbb3-type cytochrome oxidase subunit 3
MGTMVLLFSVAVLVLLSIGYLAYILRDPIE